MKNNKQKQLQLFLTGLMLFAILAAAFWGWLIQPSPFLHGKAPLKPCELSYKRELFIQAFSSGKKAQEDFLVWRQQEGAHVFLPPFIKKSNATPPTVFTQSYSAASLALALCEKNQVIAIPSQLRLQTQWHNSEIMKGAIYDTEKVDTELLYKINPERCLASHFSNPASISRFFRLNLPTLVLPTTNQIKDIETSIEEAANFMDREEEGLWLLETFKQSLLWLRGEIPKDFSSDKLNNLKNQDGVFIIELYKQMKLPSLRQLYMQWLFPGASEELQRLESTSWSTPIDYETLYTLKPKLVIILCEHLDETAERLSHDTKWQHLIQETGLKYTLVNSQCLSSASQILAIGLYDLVAALKLLNTLSPE